MAKQLNNFIWLKIFVNEGNMQESGWSMCWWMESYPQTYRWNQLNDVVSCQRETPAERRNWGEQSSHFLSVLSKYLSTLLMRKYRFLAFNLLITFTPIWKFIPDKIVAIYFCSVSFLFVPLSFSLCHGIDHSICVYCYCTTLKQNEYSHFVK